MLILGVVPRARAPARGDTVTRAYTGGFATFSGDPEAEVERVLAHWSELSFLRWTTVGFECVTMEFCYLRPDGIFDRLVFKD